jgi:acyl-CoA reductase-like NAD-dependent aldehyde dehydrogenase
VNPRLRTISPIDGRCYVERELADVATIDAALDAAGRAQAHWQCVPLASRVEVLGRAVQAFVANGAAIAEEITWQMGRPLRHSPSEIRGFEERARYMLGIAADALAPLDAGPKPGFTRQIKRVPVGVVVVLAPWNYPYLTALNSVLLMNDSAFGLTAAIYSADRARAEALGDQLETGTVFLNRCDYLDPALAWTGVKNSGRGCTLSRVGFEHLTRPKSFHFRITL